MAYIDAAISALADPTRRAVFERLAHGPASVGALAAGFPVSRPAISQHLKTLKAAGLVTDSARGTQRIYRANPEALAALRDWLDQFWSDSLAAFANEVDNQREKPSS